MFKSLLCKVQNVNEFNFNTGEHPFSFGQIRLLSMGILKHMDNNWYTKSILFNYYKIVHIEMKVWIAYWSLE